MGCDMDVVFSPNAQTDLDIMDASLRKLFLKHIEKISTMPPRRHLRFGIALFVENITKQARMIYDLDLGAMLVLRCFSTHKEYEKWYYQFK